LNFFLTVNIDKNRAKTVVEWLRLSRWSLKWWKCYTDTVPRSPASPEKDIPVSTYFIIAYVTKS